MTNWFPLLTTFVTVALGGIAAAYVAGRLSRAIKLSEFRQTWINELRGDLASYLGATHRWIRLYDDYNSLSDQQKKADFEREELRPVQNDSLVILYRIRMRLNPRQTSPTKEVDERFLLALLELLNPGKLDPRAGMETAWLKRADDAVEQGREVLKREWEVAKRRSPWWS